MTSPDKQHETPNTPPPDSTQPAHTNKQPDLLPDDYRRAIQERGTLIRRAALMALSIIITIPFVYRAQDQRTDLNQQIAQLQTELEANQQRADQLPQLQSEYDTLVLHASLIEQHNPPIDYSNIAAAISQTLTPADSIRHLKLSTITPNTQPTDAQPDAQQTAQQTDEAAPQPPHIQLTLTTLSPTEQQARSLTNRLTAMPILTNTRATLPTPTTHNNLAAHTVTITASIPLDRNYIPPTTQSSTTQTQEITNAQP